MISESCALSAAGYTPDVLLMSFTGDSGDDLGEIREIAAHN